MKTTSQFLSDLSSLGVKLWAEGDTLRYQVPKGTLTPDLLFQLRDRKTEILILLQTSTSQINDPIPPIFRTQNSPLSFAQQRLWFLEQLAGENATYNIFLALKIEGTLNQNALTQALQTIVNRHKTLRTSFTAIDGYPVQIVAPHLEIPLTVIDLGKLSQKQQENQVKHLAQEEANQPFDLAIAPLFRAKLLRRKDTSHILLLTLHHIITDGWSMGILKHEFSTLYQDALEGKFPSLAPLPIQYIDFSHWQRNWLQGKVLEQQINYWKNQLADIPPLLELPTDKPRPAIQTFTGKSQEIQLSAELSQQLKNFSQQSGVTLFMTLLTAFGVLLFRYSHQEDIVIGSPIANRNRSEIEPLIGFFANTLALKIDLQNNPSFRELLTRVKEMCLNAYSHQDLPFEKLVEELQPPRSLSYHPLFQIVFILQNTPSSTVNLTDLTITPFKVEKQTSKFDLTLSVHETTSELAGTWEYNTDLFEDATISRMIGHFQTLLAGIIANPDLAVTKLPLLTATERHQLLVEWNNTQTDYLRHQCIHQLFEEQVERTPDAIAVVFEQQKLTYQALNEKANQLAHYLHELGVKPETLVGICVERSLEMVIGLLGILKAGGAYVSLDPTYPQERLDYLVEDSQILLILTQDSLNRNFKTSTRLIYLDKDRETIAQENLHNLESGVTANNLAYITYTSGSTGQPKGVCAIHQGVVRLVRETDYANLTSEEVFLQLAPISFDASTFEIWGSLLNGAQLVIFPPHIPSLEELGQAIRRYQITTLWLTAGLFHLMVDERLEDLKPLRQLLAGGDILSVPHVQKVLANLKNCQLINGYGPTENTTFTCCYRITETTQLSKSVPIGRPIANTQVYILDSQLQPVPIGVSGELYIGGDGLARGYLNRPELTEEKFIPNPFEKAKGNRQKAKLYKTGDLARYLPDGNIEFLGRIDNQVKIRGFRIELGEIEAVLSQHLAIRETVVTVREDVPGDTRPRLVAYVVTNSDVAPSNEELRSFLKQKLPDYMMPSAFVMLDALPLTPNGKIDRRVLPAPDSTQLESANIFVAPRDRWESHLTQIWERVLSIEPIGIHDNFFALGGHSLLAVRLFAQMEQVFPCKIPLQALFELSTVAQLASVLRQEEAFILTNSAKSNSLSPSQDMGLDYCRDNSPQLSLSEQRWLLASTITKKRALEPSSLIMLEQAGNPNSHQPLFFVYLLGELGQHFSDLQPVYNLTVWTKVETFDTFIQALAAHYVKEIQAIQPSGPYLLGGYCVGGRVVFEIAQQLQAQGQQMALLTLIQTLSSDPLYARYQSLLLRSGYGFFLRLVNYWRNWLNLNPSQRLTSLWEKAQRLLARKFKSISSNNSQPNQELPEMNDDLETEILSSLKLAQKHYIPQSYTGKVALFLAREGRLYSFLFPKGGWSKLLTGQVSVHLIPGDHTSILKDPYVRVLGEKLKTCLEQAQQEISGKSQQK